GNAASVLSDELFWRIPDIDAGVAIAGNRDCGVALAAYRAGTRRCRRLLGLWPRPAPVLDKFSRTYTSPESRMLKFTCFLAMSVALCGAAVAGDAAAGKAKHDEICSACHEKA